MTSKLQLMSNRQSIQPQFPTVIRPFYRGDKTAVFRLLAFLPDLYPNGDKWLDFRLNEVLQGKARCKVVSSGKYIVGVAIETPKGIKKKKISTFYIHPCARRLRLGTRLLDSLISDWINQSVEGCHITVDSNRAKTLTPLLNNFDFRFVSRERSRYGDDRDELVFDWVR
jgi:hypothetical protein